MSVNLVSIEIGTASPSIGADIGIVSSLGSISPPTVPARAIVVPPTNIAPVNTIFSNLFFIQETASLICVV